MPAGRNRTHPVRTLTSAFTRYAPDIGCLTALCVVYRQPQQEGGVSVTPLPPST